MSYVEMEEELAAASMQEEKDGGVIGRFGVVPATTEVEVATVVLKIAIMAISNVNDDIDNENRNSVMYLYSDLGKLGTHTLDTSYELCGTRQ
ncbi:hypothetical protein F0562_011603 [Nyssa sinensis]|uniref:Uncharacterized protein n=1 Tax=Nyssa sinensis TaxID=561372 RepID=A0A5J4ZR57_9ASTE|nr:hypothetical protein F0562_011603 [Nyssa sinensis]